LKLKCDEALSNVAFSCNLRRYEAVSLRREEELTKQLSGGDHGGRGLHSSTFQLNLSASCGIGGAFSGCLGAV